ncbi:reverse transcriptase domain-containing protein [Tanacetum coccineum]
MFWQTLGGAARNWFNDLDPKSVDSFEELSQKFLEEFSQQKRYAKDPTEIHGIKRRQNEGLQAFMDWFKSESSHIKGVPPVLRISAFMHGHGHSELAKKLNDKIPKMVDEMFERVRAFIRGEVAAGGGPREARRNMGVYTPYPRKDTFTPLTKTPKEILAMESVSFPEPPPLIRTPKNQNLNKFCDYHRDRGHNTNDCYQLKKQIEEAVTLGKLAHIVTDIRRNNQRNGNPGRNGVKVINMIRQEGNRKRSFEERRSGMMNELTFPAIPRSQLTDEPIILEGIIEGNQVRRILVDGGSSSEIMYEHCFRNLGVNIRSRLRRCRFPMIGFSGETYHPLGVIGLRVTLGKEGRSKTVLMEFAIIKCCSPYNIIIGRNVMRSLRAVGSTIHSMIKFPTNQGVVTMETSREALQECKHLERVQGSWKEGLLQIRCHLKEHGAERMQKKHSPSAMNFRTKRTTVPRFVMEHQLKIYPLAKHVVHKRRPMASEGRLALKEKVFHWLKEGLIRKVQYPEWIASTIPIKLASETWKVQIDYSSLNKVCAKDMYPLPEEGEELASLMGYPYKCFLRLLKEYSQIRMAEDDEEKTSFHSEEGV